MYRLIIKPLLFGLNIERVHSIIVLFLRFIGSFSVGNSILRGVYRVKHPSLTREVLGLKFTNPIGVAAGFDKNADIIKPLEAIGFGFVEIGSVTPDAQSGSTRPRIFRLKQDGAIIERAGSPNLGWKQVVNSLRKKRKSIVVGCNISASSEVSQSQTEASYLKTFRNLYQYSDYFTVNLLSTELLDEEQLFSSERINGIIKPLFEFRRGQSEYRQILLKVSPDLSNQQLDQIVEILINTPLDGLVAVSGSTSREGLKTSPLTLSKVGDGRLCGEPLKERALEVVRYLHKATEGNYPIIGVGGVSTGEDAQRMLDAGASLVQVYSSFIYQGPKVVKRICSPLIKEGEQKSAK